MIDYPPEQLDELYEKLPADLQEAFDSEKTGNIVYDICLKQGVEQVATEVLKYVGYVLLGLLPPNELEKTLKEELGLKNNIAAKTSLEINNLVFYPVKESLEALYKIKIESLIEEKPPLSQKPQQKRAPDTYREPIE